MDESTRVGFHGLSPITAELIGEISRLTMALFRAEQQLKAAMDEVAALRKQLATSGEG